MAWITTTMQVILDAEPVLKRLDALPLPMSVSDPLSRLLDQIVTQTIHFNKMQAKAVKTLGVKRPATPQERVQFNEEFLIAVPSDKLEELHSQIQELRDSEIEIRSHPFKLSMLDKIEISSAELRALRPFIADDTTPDGRKVKPRKGSFNG